VTRLQVNIVSCDGVGICAHLAPDVVRVDTWGFPIVADTSLSGGKLRQARAAVRACPRRALFLADSAGSATGGTRVNDVDSSPAVLFPEFSSHGDECAPL
jgi:ferredoxin